MALAKWEDQKEQSSEIHEAHPKTSTRLQTLNVTFSKPESIFLPHRAWNAIAALIPRWKKLGN
jgi:hypothetical protein